MARTWLLWSILRPVTDFFPPLEQPPRRRRRTCLRLALVGLVAFPPLFLLVALFRTRHIPWDIPAEWRAPAPPGPPPASGGAGLWVTYLGVTGYRITDGKTTLLVDPTPTRPSGLELLGAIESDAALVASWCPKADAVLVNHAHHDHVLDVPNVAKHTGAVVFGSPSTLGYCRSRAVPEAQLKPTKAGDRLAIGSFTVDVRGSYHTAIFGKENPLAGRIPDDAGALRWWEFGQDGCFAFRLAAGGATLWFHPTSTYQPGGLGGLEARTIILGITGERLTLERAKGVLTESKAARVLPTHFDNFLQPIGKGMGLLLDLDIDAARETVRQASPQAAWWVLDFGQTVHLPPD